MPSRESRNHDICVLVDDTRFDLVGVHVTALGEFVLIPIRICARVDIDPVCFHQVGSHRVQALWAVHLQGESPADCPRREYQVWVSDRVIRMQMCEEYDPQLRRL